MEISNELELTFLCDAKHKDRERDISQFALYNFTLLDRGNRDSIQLATPQKCSSRRPSALLPYSLSLKQHQLQITTGHLVVSRVQSHSPHPSHRSQRVQSHRSQRVQSHQSRRRYPNQSQSASHISRKYLKHKNLSLMASAGQWRKSKKNMKRHA